MLHFQNTYTPGTGSQIVNGRRPVTGDWSSEITPMSPAMPQQQTRMPSDTGMGGMMAGTDMPAENRMAGTVTPPPLADMRNNLPVDVIEAPTSSREAYLGSLKAMLARYVGSYIVATFLVGTQNTVSWEGILFDVGNDYLTIYQEARDRYIVSDYYSLKFMEFYDLERRRRCAQLLQEEGWQNNGTNSGVMAP